MVAGGKGHSGCSWFLGGFLFGPLALLATLGLRDQKRDWDARRLINTQEEMLDEIQRKHAWERRQWEGEKKRQYLEAEYREKEVYRLPPEQEEWDEEPDEVGKEVIDVSNAEENSLNDYLHTLEYDEDVPDLLEKLNALGMETKAEFIDRLKWNIEVPEDQVAEQLFAEHIWKEVLNKSDEADYQEFWEKELAQSFLIIETQDNAYFLKRNHR